MYLQLQIELRLKEYQPVINVGLVLVTDSSILWYCGMDCQLIDLPKQYAERHCCCSVSSTHQKRFASWSLLLVYLYNS